MKTLIASGGGGGGLGLRSMINIYITENFLRDNILDIKN